MTRKLKFIGRLWIALLAYVMLAAFIAGILILPWEAAAYVEYHTGSVFLGLVTWLIGVIGFFFVPLAMKEIKQLYG